MHLPLRSWNPGCDDAIDSNAYYINLLKGSFGAAIRIFESDYSACYETGELRPGEPCPPETPICKEGKCSTATCADAAPYCHFESVAGVRARQVCPQTCGCATPRSPLALSQPNSGCPLRCIQSTPYREALQSLPCEDVAVDDPAFTGFLDSWENVSITWPKDWYESSLGFISFFRRWGCSYLAMTSPPAGITSADLFWPPNFQSGVNPCVENGNFYPVRPLSYFCPRACGCRAGDQHCPGTCPARNSSRTDFSGLGPQYILPSNEDLRFW